MVVAARPTLGRMMGSLVIDELVFPVVGVRLHGGGFEIVAEIQGPTRAIDSSDYVVQGDDGQTVYRSARRRNRIKVAAMTVGDTIRVTAFVTVDNKQAQTLDD